MKIDCRRILEPAVKSNINPKAEEIAALKDIIDGKPADSLALKRLVTCNLVEELNGTAILTDKGLQTAERLMADATEENTMDARRK